MGMLNAHDIRWMEDTVREVISEWNTKISIYSRLPLEEQPNYNHLMREFTGDSYCKVLTVIAERKDIVNNMTNDPDPDNIDFGRKDNGTFLYAIPDVIKVTETTKDENGNDVSHEVEKKYSPTLHDVVTIGDGEVYYIRSIRSRIGETLLTIKRFTGNKPTISTVDDNIIIRDYDWSGGND